MIVTVNDKNAFAMRIIGADGSDLTREYCVASYNTITKYAWIAEIKGCRMFTGIYNLVHWPGSKLVLP